MNSLQLLGLALDFANMFFTTWLKDMEKDMNSLVSNLKKAEIDGKLLVSFLLYFSKRLVSVVPTQLACKS